MCGEVRRCSANGSDLRRLLQLALLLTPASAVTQMDHSALDHSQMDHAAIDQAAPEHGIIGHAQMDQGAMDGPMDGVHVMPGGRRRPRCR